MGQTVRRVFPDGDYPARLVEAYAAFEHAAADAEAEGPSGATLDEGSPVATLAREYQALKAEAEQDAASKGRVVVLRAIGRREWRRLREGHPPRAGEGVDADTAKGDRLAGVNTDTVEDDLVNASLVSPEFSSRAAFDEWADQLSEGEWQQLVQDAWRLVNVAQFDPKSLPPSLIPSDGAS